MSKEGRKLTTRFTSVHGPFLTAGISPYKTSSDHNFDSGLDLEIVFEANWTLEGDQLVVINFASSNKPKGHFDPPRVAAKTKRARKVPTQS